MPGYDLTLQPFLWRAENLYPDTSIVSYSENEPFRYDYQTYARRTARLANALLAAGVRQGDRIATCCWNHHRHFDVYFAAPGLGIQFHTVNPLLPDAQIEYILRNAADQLLFLDPSVLPQIEGIVENEGAFDAIERYVVMDDSVPETSLDRVTDFERFVAGHEPTVDWPHVAENLPVGLCYTSGTTGEPKGVEYTQKMVWAHTMANLNEQGHAITESDTVMHVVPMFHINGWGMPFEATAVGASQIFPGVSPDAKDLVEIIESEGVTYTAGVPTVFLDVLRCAEEHGADLSSLERIVIGGSSVPEHMIRTYQDEYGVELRQAWGMTEIAGVGATSYLKSANVNDADVYVEKTQLQGLILPGLEFRVLQADGAPVDWDGESTGELEIRGPWVTTEYFKRPDATVEAIEDGWLSTGDIVTVDEEGYIEIVDRMDDLIKSGGEWISSVDLENALMDHEAVGEATVVGAPHDEWGERPLAVVSLKSDSDSNQKTLVEELERLVQAEYPDWWVPDEFVFVEALPRTATGKFDKKSLRDKYASRFR